MHVVHVPAAPATSAGFTGTVVVIAKQPVPGAVKTRLIPALNPEQASALAAAALADTLDVVDAAAVRGRVLAFAGDPAQWLRPGWRIARQPAGGLDVRLAAAFRAAGSAPAVVVGMDTPQLTPDLLQRFNPLRFDACLGPANDGGYWLLGLADPTAAEAALLGVPMSTAHTGAAQHARLSALGMRVQILDPLTDVDRIEDAVQVAGEAPRSRFAAELAGFRLPDAVGISR